MDETKRDSLFFQVDWSAFNYVAGIKFAVGMLAVAILTRFTEFTFIVISIASLMAWLTDVPGTIRNRVLGMVGFALAAIGTLWLASIVHNNLIWFTLAMFVVTFIFTLPMALSLRGYMVGWVTILWFFSIAPMTTTGDIASMTWDVLIGVGIVVAITLIWPSGIGPYGHAQAPDSPDGGGIDDRAFVLVYALTVALVMAFAIFVGLQLFTVGAVWIVNGAFMVLGPSTRQSWIHAVERATVVIVGVLAGLLLIRLIDSVVILTVIWAVSAFLAIAALNAGYPVAIGSYTAGMTMTWAVQGLDVGSLNASERIYAEALAIGLAIAATVFLNWWSSRRNVNPFAETEASAN